MLNKNLTLGEFIIKNQASFKYSSGELSSLINSIRLAAKIVNHEVNKAGLVDIIGKTGGENIQFEKQQKLDVYANEKFIKTDEIISFSTRTLSKCKSLRDSPIVHQQKRFPLRNKE